jgi:hypothetical protein
MSTRVIQTIRTLRRSTAAVALVAGLVLPSAAALAATQVNGNPQDVSIDAQNSSLKDILTALSKQFGIQFQTTANLDRPVTGTYEGSLRRVVTRLLEGYNFIITSHDDQIHVTVLGTGAPEQIGGAAARSVQLATAQQPKAVAAAANPIPSQQAATAAGSNEGHSVTGQQRKSTKKESPADVTLPQLKIAEGGPAPVPAPVPAGTSGPGPMPGPATNSLPKPNPAANGGPSLPTPAPVSANGPQLPMPTEVKPFPMSAGSVNAPLPGPPASTGAAPTKR